MDLFSFVITELNTRTKPHVFNIFFYLVCQVTGALAGDVSVSVQFDEVTGRLMSDEEIHRKISECKRRLGIPEEVIE